MVKKLIVLMLFCLSGLNLTGQAVEDLFDAYVDENSSGYIQPLSDLFTSALNTGIREWSAIDTALYFRIGMVASIAFPSTAQKTFTASTDPNFDPHQTAEVPTIIGNIQPVYVNGVNGTIYVFPGGYNLKRMPMATPQVTVGGIFNTEFTARYFAFELDDNFGKVSMLGLGLRHAINPYFKSIPIDLSVGYFYHQFKDEPYLVHDAHLFTVHIGKSGKIWSAQLIGAVQSSNTDVKYQYTRNGETKVNKIQLSNSKTMAVELSAAIRLAIINLHSSIQYSEGLTVAAGISLHF
ncbi:MAG: hypothetical protein IPM92_03240 [Saprospiraceae bacterium]|nr:hypothetical protein [Saprospiraceae bacterium]